MARRLQLFCCSSDCGLLRALPGPCARKDWLVVVSRTDSVCAEALVFDEAPQLSALPVKAEAVLFASVLHDASYAVDSFCPCGRTGTLQGCLPSSMPTSSLVLAAFEARQRSEPLGAHRAK